MPPIWCLLAYLRLQLPNLTLNLLLDVPTFCHPIQFVQHGNSLVHLLLGHVWPEAAVEILRTIQKRPGFVAGPWSTRRNSIVHLGTTQRLNYRNPGGIWDGIRLRLVQEQLPDFGEF